MEWLGHKRDFVQSRPRSFLFSLVDVPRTCHLTTRAFIQCIYLTYPHTHTTQTFVPSLLARSFLPHPSLLCSNKEVRPYLKMV